MKYGRIPLSRQRAKQLFWLLAGWILLAGLGSLIGALVGQEGDYQGWAFRSNDAIIGLASGLIAAVILWRYPRHVFGWLGLLLAAISTTRGALTEYTIYTLEVNPGTLPGGLFIAWFQNWNWYVMLTLVTLQMMVFPDGRLPSRRWRAVVWTLLALTVLFSGFLAFTPGPMDSSYRSLENPYGLSALDLTVPLLVLVSPFVISLGVGALALLVRLRRARGVERQQLKWFLYAGFVLVLASPLAPSSNDVQQGIFAVLLLLPPAVMAMAILRYRLWDIDLIIRRTAVYGLLSALLALLYFGSVTALQLIFTALSGQQSPAALVISTLVIAAIFTPLRRRIQAFIDRRFYRRKYDAGRALNQFAATARSEVELERLTTELLRLVRESVQPEAVSLWLRPREPGNGRTQ